MSLKTPFNRDKSPAYIAATRAAAKSTPTHTGQDVSRTTAGHPANTRPPRAPQVESNRLPSTSALVKLFEAKDNRAGDTQEAQRVVRETTRPTSFIADPTPIRPVVSVRLAPRPPRARSPFTDGGNDLSAQAINHSRTLEKPPDKRSTANSLPPKKTLSKPIDDVTNVSARRVLPKSPLTRRNTHPPLSVSEVGNTEPSKNDDTSSVSSYTSALASPITRSKSYTQKGGTSISVRPLSPPIKRHHSSPSAVPPLHGPRSSLQIRRSPYSQSSRPTSQLSVDSLANAIVAGSLAASRAPSPTKQTLPLTPRRRSKAHALFHHHDHSSRTPSPARVLRQTLRPPITESDDGPRTRKPNPFRKHPNKHHEGDRKRWREQVTEAERKRYEGVWQVNKGILLVPGPDPSNPKEFQELVSNLVVRDIWSRSQISFNTLAEIWDRVDRRGDGKLGREEFVVGMWLCDQWLKGKKTPVTISESIWSSVRHPIGITIPTYHHRR